MADRVQLEIDGSIATITNNNPEKHNAFDDDMDAQLFAILDELARRNDIRAVIWRGEGKSFSSGRDASSIGNLKVELSHHELMRRGHRGIQRVWDIDAPVLVEHTLDELPGCGLVVVPELDGDARAHEIDPT